MSVSPKVSQSFISTNLGTGKVTVELWFDMESDVQTECGDFNVRTHIEVNKWSNPVGYGKFTHSETSTVESFNTKAKAVAAYNRELIELGDPNAEGNALVF